MSRTRFAHPENLLRFHADLDPVAITRVDESAAVLTGVTFAALMRGLILGTAIPVLAENQLFDSPALLRLASDDDPRTRSDFSAFLRLADAGYIQSAVQAPGLGGSASLIGAFSRALRDPNFTLTAWPEINDDPASRLELAGEIESSPDPRIDRSLQPRIDGLLAIDAAFHSPRIAQPIPAPLIDFVRRERDERSSAAPYIHAWLDRLRQSAGASALDMNRRSNWRRLTSELRGGADDAWLDGIDTLVNIAYNRKVAQSVQAALQRESASDTGAAKVLISDQDATAIHQEMALLVESPQGNGIDWHTVWELLDTGMVPSDDDPPNRARRKLSDVRDFLVDRRAAAEVERAPTMMAYRFGRWLAPRVAGAGIGVWVGTTSLTDPLSSAIVGHVTSQAAESFLETCLSVDKLQESLIKKKRHKIVASISSDLSTK